MASRDYDSAPANETLGLDRIIKGLASDLDELRAGKISTQDAIARSMLAKQIFNGVRLYLTGTKILSQRAVVAGTLASGGAESEPGA
jgi:hypothetical protein